MLKNAALIAVVALCLSGICLIAVVITHISRSSSSESSKSLASTSPSPGSPENLPQDDASFDLPALVKRAKPAVLSIVGFDATRRIKGTGSAFFVSDDGRIATNWHVIAGVTSATAHTEDGALYDIKGVLAVSEDQDLVVLKADTQHVRFLEVNRMTSPEAGTRIAIIGSPRGLEGSVSEGIVAAERKSWEGTWLQITAPISPGSSGSPVLDRTGRVVGIATRTSSGRFQNLNFARSTRDLAALIENIPAGAQPQPFTAATLPKVRTYHVVATPADDKQLNVRGGPGLDLPVITKLAPLEHGITLGEGREQIGQMFWQEITTRRGDHGWVSGLLLAPDSLNESRLPVVTISALKNTSIKVVTTTENGQTVFERSITANAMPLLFQGQHITVSADDRDAIRIKKDGALMKNSDRELTIESR